MIINHLVQDCGIYLEYMVDFNYFFKSNRDYLPNRPNRQNTHPIIPGLTVIMSKFVSTFIDSTFDLQ